MEPLLLLLLLEPLQLPGAERQGRGGGLVVWLLLIRVVVLSLHLGPQRLCQRRDRRGLPLRRVGKEERGGDTVLRG